MVLGGPSIEELAAVISKLKGQVPAFAAGDPF
jgi:hypothetical protein